MKEFFYALLWLNLMGLLNYSAVCLAMMKGWGIQPKDWFWIILGYSLVANMWVLTIVIRENILKALGLTKMENGEEKRA